MSQETNKMNLSLAIDVNNLEHITAFYRFALAVGGHDFVTPTAVAGEKPVAEEKPKQTRTRKTKEEIPAPTINAPAAEETEEEETEEEEDLLDGKTETKTAWKIEDLLEAASEVIANDPTGARKVRLKIKLTELGASKVSLLLPKQFDEFMTFIKSI